MTPVAPGPGHRGLAAGAGRLGALGATGLSAWLAVGPLLPDSGWAAPPFHPPEGAAEFADGPPARVTGGFGEDSCAACHWEFEDVRGPGELAIVGLPDRVDAGRPYHLTVELTHPDTQTAGFQMSARFAADTTQAGTFEVPDEETRRVQVVEEREILFAQHRLDGTGVTRPGTTRWQVVWTAPARDGEILFHVSTVAGDGDRSQMGDHVYTLEAGTTRNAD